MSLRLWGCRCVSSCVLLLHLVGHAQLCRALLSVAIRRVSVLVEHVRPFVLLSVASPSSVLNLINIIIALVHHFLSQVLTIPNSSSRNLPRVPPSNLVKAFQNDELWNRTTAYTLNFGKKSFFVWLRECWTSTLCEWMCWLCLAHPFLQANAFLNRQNWKSVQWYPEDLHGASVGFEHVCIHAIRISVPEPCLSGEQLLSCPSFEWSFE